MQTLPQSVIELEVLRMYSHDITLFALKVVGRSFLNPFNEGNIKIRASMGWFGSK